MWFLVLKPCHTKVLIKLRLFHMVAVLFSFILSMFISFALNNTIFSFNKVVRRKSISSRCSWTLCSQWLACNFLNVKTWFLTEWLFIKPIWFWSGILPLYFVSTVYCCFCGSCILSCIVLYRECYTISPILFL